MKGIIIIAAIAITLAALYGYRMSNRKPSRLFSDGEVSFYDLSVPSIEGDTIQFSDFRGKYVLCVNVASKCGYTPQYKGLQELSQAYPGKLVVIGFPCNQFLGQEPGTEEEIVSFCEKNYGVTFPLSAKIAVKGQDQHPVYQWLTHKDLNGMSDAEVKWNFHKFLISPEGKWIQNFGSKVEPMSTEITSLIK